MINLVLSAWGLFCGIKAEGPGGKASLLDKGHFIWPLFNWAILSLIPFNTELCTKCSRMVKSTDSAAALPGFKFCLHCLPAVWS